MRRDTILKALGEEIRAERESRKLTQEALAFGSGLDRNSVGNCERGESNPELTTLVRIAHGLDIPLTQLIAGMERRLGRGAPATRMQ